MSGWDSPPFKKGDRVRETIDGRTGTVDSVHDNNGTCDVVLDTETRTDARGRPNRHGFLWLDLRPLDVIELLGELA